MQPSKKIVGASSCQSICRVTQFGFWQKLNESLALLFFLFQVTVCLAMYIVTILGIIISFCLRLTIIMRLKYYGYYYYELDAHVRAVSRKQTGHNSCFFFQWYENEPNLVSHSSGFLDCNWVSHDHLGCVCVWNPHVLKYCSTFGSEVPWHSGKSCFTSLNSTNQCSLSYFSINSGV